MRDAKLELLKKLSKYSKEDIVARQCIHTGCVS